MKKTKTIWLLRTISALTLFTMFLGGSVANAAILFQDDTFHDIDSEAILIDANGTGAENTSIQFGNDATLTENGTINWNITTNTFEFDHKVDITGGLSSDGNVDFSAAAQNLLRKDSAPNTNSACQTLGEVIINTTTNRLEVCTTTGVAGVAVWSAPTVSIPSGAADPGTCSASDLFFNTTLGELRICTALNTWETAGPQDFESIYSHDADKTLTTGGTNFSIASGGGDVLFGLGAGEFDVTSTGLIDFNSASFTLDTTAGISLDAGATSNFTTSAGDLNFGASAGDINIVAGDDLFFDDLQLSSAVQLTNTATGIAATYGTNGIIDALNTLTSTASGEGASNVGIEDSGAYFTGTNVELALQELGASSGSNAANNEILNFYPEYPDAVIYKDGTNNRGRLDALYDNANAEHYYEWTSRKAALQDIDVRFRFPLPADFLSVNNFTFGYRTGTAVVADNKVDITVNNDTDSATCGSSTGNVNAGAWATGTITKATLETGCTGGTVLNAGDIIEVIVKLFDNSGAADFADIGLLTLGYDN
ncbi:hypothetical protein KJ951_03725 [Patescibacteria group bacterium]|nr:hypothetical protein [Patescibacteria group bacterium]MBU1703486.1 hypothetical protein [Patescibacteria group bacterium]MBU1953700.1 hypothetical protein [Patescibacteria group bacterium]